MGWDKHKEVKLVQIQPLQNVLNAAARIALQKFDSNAARLKGQTAVTAHSGAGRTQDVCTDTLMFTSGCANLSNSDVHMTSTCFRICTSNSPSICNAWRPCSTCSRTTRYRQRSFAFSGPRLWSSLLLTVRDPSLSARLKTILAAEVIKHHHSVAVTV